MRTDLDLVAIVGSLRVASVNRVVMETARSLLADGATLTEVAIDGVPFFSGDVEDAGDPPSVRALKNTVAGSDGLIIFTPEYNVGVPALVKNAIDWLSRPYGSGAVADTPIGVVASSPGGRGGLGVRRHLSDTLAVLAPRLHEPMLGIGKVTADIVDGRLTGEPADELTRWLADFVTFAVTET